jgi:hypothetical protein
MELPQSELSAAFPVPLTDDDSVVISLFSDEDFMVASNDSDWASAGDTVSS